ncbi:response regulator, partial [Achromobacter sp. Marseille-Q0513]|uniref:response regulator n=1 Tax=Achromobacter sp. Marseille-Q0513 TaxID=2829161 RepID=UPI001B9ABA04
MHLNRQIAQEWSCSPLYVEGITSYLSQVQAQDNLPQTPEKSGGRASMSELYVALVGHDPMQADLLCRLLVQQGFQVGVFDAWSEDARISGVDLIVVDLNSAGTRDEAALI